MFKNLQNILEKKDFLKFKFIFFFNSVLSIFEFVSVISIPIFISILIEPDIFLNKVKNHEILNFLNELSNFDLLVYFSIFIILIFFLKNVALVFFIITEQNQIKRVKTKILQKLFNFYVNAPYLIHIKRSPEVFSRIISHEIDHLVLHMSHLCKLFRDVIALLVIFFILLYASPLITTITLLFFILIAFSYSYKIKPIVNSKSKLNLFIQKKLFQVSNETFFGIRDLKTMSKEKDVSKIFEGHQKELANNIFVFKIVESLPKIIFEIIAVVFVLLVTLILSINQNYIEILPKISLFAVCTFRFIPAFNSIITSRTYLGIAKPYMLSIEKEIQIEKNFIKDNNNNELNKTINLSLKKDKIINLREINFSYPEEKKTSLKDINIEIDKGSTVGITGVTGAGKSTLFYIMLGLIRPDKGAVFNYEKNIFNDLKSWREKIGYISQNIFLMDDTIKKNITFNFSGQDIDDEKFEKALHYSDIAKKISELDQGANTLIGTNGIRLSGGERQRIAIARAIYRDPEIYFMDEATSALDDMTEKKIIDNFNKNFKSKTKIIIAHRHTSLESCDNVKKLQKGTISE
jgi:ATP-binding cassette, subfamily B, bacterial PglK